MASTAAARRAAPLRRKRPRPAPASWWGEGPPPHERWPGVTIEIPCAWSQGRARWESPDGRYYFDADAAAKACEFFPTFLTHHIGEHAGRRFELLDYQRLLIVLPLFGWRRSSDDARRFRFVFVFVPKGNGKSPLGSGLGLFLTLCDDEPAAEVYAVAGDKDQARIVHESAKIMVEESADLDELCEVLKDSIYCPTSRGFYKVLSADAAGKHGKRPHAVIFDELHNQRNRELYEALRKSMIKRRQPVLLMLSHAGDDDEAICFEEYEHAKRVLKGTSKDEGYLPVIFEADEKADWSAPAVWRRANPGFGLTINPEGFAAECQAALEEPRKRNDFLRYNLNRWVGQAVAWIPVERWDAITDPLPPDVELAKLQACAGLDMAQKIDLASFVVTLRQFLDEAVSVQVQVEDEDGALVNRVVSMNYRVLAVPFFWLPEETLLEREKEGLDFYRSWQQSGLLTVTEGAAIDYDRVFRDITEKIVPRFPLLKQGEIGYDPAFATEIANRLRDSKGMKTVEVLQNYAHMNEPCQLFEALVKQKRLVHGGHKLLRWCVENVAVKRDDAGRIRPVRPKRVKKIDGAVAALMGLNRLVQMPGPRPKQSFKVEYFG